MRLGWSAAAHAEASNKNWAITTERLAVMDVGLSGKRIQSIQQGYTLVLQIDDVHFVAVSSPFVVDLDGETTLLSPEDDPEDAFEPVLHLIGQTIEAATVDPVGALNITFEGGARLHVGPDPDYEAWNVSGPDGALVVSMPGGELAIWSTQPPEGSSDTTPEPRSPDGPTTAPEQQEEEVASRFSFLGAAQAQLLSAILGRRNPTLSERLGQTGSVSRVHAEAIMSVISDEVGDNLGDDWEPTEYGREVSALLARFNAARVSEWP